MDGSSDLSSGESYTYDANGNMLTRVENGVTYTQTFRQAQCGAYDGDGNPSASSGQAW